MSSDSSPGPEAESAAHEVRVENELYYLQATYNLLLFAIGTASLSVIQPKSELLECGGPVMLLLFGITVAADLTWRDGSKSAPQESGTKAESV